MSNIQDRIISWGKNNGICSTPKNIQRVDTSGIIYRIPLFNGCEKIVTIKH